MEKEMIKLIVKARNTDELMDCWEILGAYIREGNTYGTLMDGWDISRVPEEDIL